MCKTTQLTNLISQSKFNQTNLFITIIIIIIVLNFMKQTLFAVPKLMFLVYKNMLFEKTVSQQRQQSFTVAIDKDANPKGPTNGLDVFFTRYESGPLVFNSQLFLRHKRDRSMNTMLNQCNPIIPCPFHRLTGLPPPQFMWN